MMSHKGGGKLKRRRRENSEGSQAAPINHLKELFKKQGDTQKETETRARSPRRRRPRKRRCVRMTRRRKEVQEMSLLNNHTKRKMKLDVNRRNKEKLHHQKTSSS